MGPRRRARGRRARERRRAHGAGEEQTADRERGTRYRARVAHTVRDGGRGEAKVSGLRGDVDAVPGLGAHAGASVRRTREAVQRVSDGKRRW